LLHNMQTEVKHVVGHMTEQVRTAKEEALRGEATEKLLNEMNVSIMQVAEAIQHISSYMNEQTKHIQHVGAQTKEVAEIADETSAGAQEVSQVTMKQSENIAFIDKLTEDLESCTRDLKRTIEQFTM